MKRLFIAINLPQNIKGKIDEAIKKIRSPENARFIPPENWHLTLVFLGYQPDEAFGPILESFKETVRNFPFPTVEFDKIIYGPPDKPPRMIWLIGTKETSKTLGGIKIELENNLIKNGVKFKKDYPIFNSHLTLARFPAISKNSQLSDYPLPISFIAPSLDLMESHLKRSGAEYEILSSFKFAQ